MMDASSENSSQRITDVSNRSVGKNNGTSNSMEGGVAIPTPPQQLPSAIEFEPPLACIRRILKNALPSSTNVGKDACAAFARASGIFIIYLTACANDFARENKRQTITANDVLAAIKELDFDDFTTDMLAFLNAYRQSEKTKKTAKAAAAATKKDEGTNETDDEDDEEAEDGVNPMPSDPKDDDDDDDKVAGDETDLDEEDEEEPKSKRVKLDDQKELGETEDVEES